MPDKCEVCNNPIKEGEPKCGCEICARLFGPCCNSVEPDLCVECVE